MPDEDIRAFEGREAAGVWMLRIEDDNEGDAGVLLCWKLEITRNVVQTVSAGTGKVRAELSFREVDRQYADVLLRIYRAGKLRFQGAPAGCKGRERPPASARPVTVRDLDGDGEPEVLVDLYSGGAHCCTYTLPKTSLGILTPRARSKPRSTVPFGRVASGAVLKMTS